MAILTLLLVPLQLQAAVIDECEGLQSSDIFIDAQVLQQRRMQCACAQCLCVCHADSWHAMLQQDFYECY